MYPKCPLLSQPVEQAAPPENTETDFQVPHNVTVDIEKGKIRIDVLAPGIVVRFSENGRVTYVVSQEFAKELLAPRLVPRQGD